MKLGSIGVQRNIDPSEHANVTRSYHSSYFTFHDVIVHEKGMVIPRHLLRFQQLTSFIEHELCFLP